MATQMSKSQLIEKIATTTEVSKKAATKARKGTNPFTGEEMMFKAKPARKIVRARPVKAAKDAV